MSLGRSDRVIYLGSFSKIMFRSLRLGYVVAPPGLVPEIRATLAEFGPTASALAQPALAGFMEAGHLAAHIRRMRRLYAERQQALAHELETTLGGLLTATRQNAGMHVPAYFHRDARGTGQRHRRGAGSGRGRHRGVTALRALRVSARAAGFTDGLHRLRRDRNRGRRQEAGQGLTGVLGRIKRRRV